MNDRLTRSSITASATMAMPTTRPRPGERSRSVSHRLLAETAGADEGGDDDDAERHVDRLVDAGHDRRHRLRQLHLDQQSGGRCDPNTCAASTVSGWHAADAEGGEPHHRRKGVDDVATAAGTWPMPNSSTAGTR